MSRNLSTTEIPNDFVETIGDLRKLIASLPDDVELANSLIIEPVLTLDHNNQSIALPCIRWATARELMDH